MGYDKGLNKVSLLSFVPPCVREFGYGLRVDDSMCNIAWSKILIAKVHLPLLDYFENELHVADVLPIADSACPIVIDTLTIRLRNIDNIEIVKTMLCKATTAILYSSLIAKGYNSLADDHMRIPARVSQWVKLIKMPLPFKHWSDLFKNSCLKSLLEQM